MKNSRKFTIVVWVNMMVALWAILPAFGAGKVFRMGYLQGDLHQLACWVALEKGFFKKENVAVEIAGTFKAGPEEMTGFASGSLDVGYVGEAPATMAVANKMADVVVLAQVNTEGSAIVVRKASDIDAVTDLTGKTVAVPGFAQVQDFLLRKAFATHGVDAGKVNVIVLKPPEMIEALRTSQIDAFIAWEPYIAKAVTLGAGRVLINSSQIWPAHPCCVLIADAGLLKTNPDQIKGIVRAHVSATDFIHRNREEAVKIGKKYTGMDENTIRMAMRNITYTYALSVEGEMEYVTFLNKLGYMTVDDPETFTDRFINGDILMEVIEK